MHRTKVKVLEDVLDANDTIAQANRADFDRAGVTVVNLMSAPGAGKTSLLEAALGSLVDVRVGVLEGDVQGTQDAERIASIHTPAGDHVPVAQINTDPGFGGECHLDANMVRSALPSLPLEWLDLLVIENVGNLVCPAEFRVGEDVRVMVSSVTEGEDKPLKYPLMFRACELVLVNKIDLLPHLDFDLEEFLANLDDVHPGVERLLVSARTGEGVDGVVRLARGARPGARPGVTSTASTGAASALLTRRLERRAAASEQYFTAEADRIARLCHRMAERFAARRTAARFGVVAAGPLRRAPRGGRVRSSGDRREAGTAGDRPHGRRRLARLAGRPDRATRDIVIAVDAGSERA